MELILFGLIALIVIAALLASRLVDNTYPFPFDTKPMVYTSAERNFSGLLEQAVGDKYRIVNRVRLSDILTIRAGVSKKSRQSAINKANNKYLDFVLCHKDSMKLIGAIDLVDTNGNGYKTNKDWFVAGALEAASVPHARIKIKSNYSLDEIKNFINQQFLSKNFSQEPKFKGRVVPAPMIKARPKNVGVIAKSAIEKAGNTIPKLSNQGLAALPS